MNTLHQPIAKFILGPTLYEKEFNALDIYTLNDLLWYLPRNYAYPGKFVSFNELVEGENVTIVGRIIGVSGRRMVRRKGYLITVTITDDTSTLEIPFWVFRPQIFKFMLELFKKESLGLWTGTVGEYNGKLSLQHPDFQIIGGAADIADATEQSNDYEQFYNDFSKPIPLYKGTKKLSSFKIHKTILAALKSVKASDFNEVLPTEILEKYKNLSLFDALQILHNPADAEAVPLAQERIKLEEAFLTQSILLEKRKNIAKVKTHSYPVISDGFLSKLKIPFQLTKSQQQVGKTIANALSQTTPLNALLHGDVGSGKTIVALQAALQVVDRGGQAILLAPTEVLAQQHYETITKLLEPMEKSIINVSGIKTSLLTGSTKNKKQIYLDINSGDSNIIIGTHALFNDKLMFNNLGLVIIDEQHRFGVEQRAKLLDSDNPPHLLMMTATPIPRTLAITIFGDMQLLSLNEAPANRKPVVTRYVIYESPKYMKRVYQRLAEEVSKGHQAFIVVPRIEEKGNGKGKLKHNLITVDDALELFSKNVSDVKIKTMHGKMKPAEKQQIMSDFQDKKFDVLISTTVIEVGIDIPNASMMIVLDADRFGLSTLHQLRGRINRGDHESICILITHNDIDSGTKERMEAMVKIDDGFELSEVDLEYRREGDVLGESQSGFYKTFRLLRVIRDKKLIEHAHELASQYYEQIDKTALEKQISIMFSSAEAAEFLHKV